MQMLRFSVLGLIAAAALSLMTPVSFIDYRSWIIFAIVCLLTIFPLFFKKSESNGNIQKKSAVFFKTALDIISHPIALIILAGVAGYIIY